ncbi:signal transduction histidine kinase [Methylosinus sp. sav-2]|uniref:sensor histidine kinase n=1 Tax=Methylosinus sp. sav-2 TaxID=2485168 RepID=UPI00068EDA04|nr:HAMP domain-containing sensor histidine kinase [Methylosinus sp. sav-2]TDX67203.1 signal transduction histidine kinase [Methylosinus sp. sav-2]
MRPPPSLTRRLIVDLSYMQLIAIVVAWLGTTALGGLGIVGANDYWLDEFYSYYYIRDLVLQSIVRDADGTLHIEPNETLRDEMRRTPTLRYAALESMRGPALRGSSEDISAALIGITSVETRGLDFFFISDAGRRTAASAWRWKAPTGPLFIASGGMTFNWKDVVYAFRNELVSQSLYLAVVFSVSAAVAWLAVRRSLAPLRRAAEAAERIDLESLGQGLCVDDAPSEIRPLVDAVNRTLKRLDASVARMRRYTANAAHQLRTPVAILRARLENPEERGFRVDLQRDTRRIQLIVEQMLVAARLTEGQASPDRDLDLSAVARGIVADYSPLIFKARRRIAFEAPTAPVALRSNRVAIECALANLIDNALRAEPEGGTVLVRVGADRTIRVIDHGEGIDEKHRELIFEPFWRRSDEAPGNGLGLAIVQELIEMLGGRIGVATTPGGGATFVMSFPTRLRDALDEDAHAQL